MGSHMVEDHMHTDLGHSHVDRGHTHSYQHETNVGGGCGHGGCDWNDQFRTYSTSSGRANIQASKANIQTSKCNIGSMANGNKGIETRPVNMRVVWIIKVW